MARATILLLLLLTFFFFFSPSSSQCHDRDKKALLAFKDSFLSTSLDATWLESTDCCSWDGHVLCDKTTGRVNYIQFSNDNFSPGVSLNGSIPAAVGDLSALEVLMFSDLPALVGPIPPQLAKLKKLLTLSIIRTGVSGPVPPFLSKLSSLRQLDLGGNSLSGAIPPSLGSLARLTYIGLYDNQLTGTIPASLYSKLNRKYVAYLQLFGNKLTGRIPSSFGGVDFVQIDLFDNRLTGDASFLLGKSKTNLESVNLTRNGLEFDFSKVEFPESIQRLDISHNKIYGSIPDQITQLRNLFWFDVSYNELCGKIPSGGSFPLFDKKYYAHNKCLCGAPLQPCK